MKICWTTPAPPETMWGELAAVGSILPPLGLCYLAAIARDQGWDTIIIDCYAEKLSTLAAGKKISAFAPDIVGITSTTEEIDAAARLAATLKQRSPDSLIVVGGVHVTSLPRETLERYPQFDVAFIGESEATLPEFLEAYCKGRSFTPIAGLALRRPAANNLSGRDQSSAVYLTPARPPIEDLDDLPLPAFDLLPPLDRHYRPAIYNYQRLPAAGLVTSRGCPGKCSFCDRSVFGNRLRMLSADRILDIIRELKNRYAIREICFYDDTLVAHRKRFEALCKRLIAEKIDITWSCNARADMVDPERLHLMRRAGCWQISYGIESGDQDLLDVLRKRISLTQVEKAVAWSRAAGLTVKGYYMIGIPGETHASLQKTEQHLLWLPLDDILLEYFTPFPGSELYDQLLAQDEDLPDWSDLNTFELAYVPQGLDPHTLKTAYKRILKKFYLRPRIIWSYSRRFANPFKMMALARTFFKFMRSG